MDDRRNFWMRHDGETDLRVRSEVVVDPKSTTRLLEFQ